MKLKLRKTFTELSPFTWRLKQVSLQEIKHINLCYIKKLLNHTIKELCKAIHCTGFQYYKSIYIIMKMFTCD